jgi:hypothetical protein
MLWEELMAYFSLILHRMHRKRKKKIGERQRQAHGHRGSKVISYTFLYFSQNKKSSIKVLLKVSVPVDLFIIHPFYTPLDTTENKTNSVACSPKAYYTDRATAAFRKS